MGANAICMVGVNIRSLEQSRKALIIWIYHYFAQREPRSADYWIDKKCVKNMRIIDGQS